MAIDFTKVNMGNNNGGAKGQTNTAEKPKAQFWINVGYGVDVEVTNGDTKEVETQNRFVALAMGIPLDSIEPLPTNSKNQEFAMLQAAKNDLHAQIMKAAKKLEAGEEVMLNLQVQLRRVNEERAPVASDENPFFRPLDLVG